MSRKIEDLELTFQEKTKQLLANCEQLGYPMRPFCTLRSPFEQGKLWRQSRTTQQVVQQIKTFQQNGAPFLAHCIESVGPQNGRHVTNALPGFSWHQWGEAVDCFWLIDGSAEWSTRRKVSGKNGYQVYAEQAKLLGLTAGGFWRSFKDWPHVQLKKLANPSRGFSLEQINSIMEQRFS
ncbi:M15 family metallopeptidase [Pleionea litopenaei]|uniref:M15 family metallopeptidase n=1 Tax=Pleionea litopenaei TaxID=3070815 RepID=A0AA51RUX1_9GAMM|nr:M15 family metallopeptidase [Pleionea sp. HL-JVS1]WMS87929.1 M15 family metallopeptidase [Pleionea sp. HL-JVS1]